MTDRIHAITVVVKDMREDDVEPLIEAIKLLRGVVSVKTHVSDISQYSAVESAKTNIREKIGALLWSDDD